MKDTVTNGFTLHPLMKTFIMQTVAYLKYLSLPRR